MAASLTAETESVSSVEPAGVRDPERASALANVISEAVLKNPRLAMAAVGNFTMDQVEILLGTMLEEEEEL